MRLFSAISALVGLVACSAPLQEYEGPLDNCETGADDNEGVLVLDRQLGESLEGWFGIGLRPDNRGTFLMAPIEDVEWTGSELRFVAEYDFGNSSADLTADFTLNGDTYVGTIEFDSGQPFECDAELELQE